MVGKVVSITNDENIKLQSKRLRLKNISEKKKIICCDKDNTEDLLRNRFRRSIAAIFGKETNGRGMIKVII